MRDVAIESLRVCARGGCRRVEVTAAHQGVGDDTRACADGDRVLAGAGGLHAAVGGEVGEALVVELEQQPSGDVMSVGGQCEDPEPGVTGEGRGCCVHTGEQGWKVVGQAGVAAE